MDKRKAAGKDYAAGMKYKDISAKYGVPIGTLKSWRTRNGWKKNASTVKRVQPKQKKDAPKVAPKIIDELEANSELTDKQKLFCLFYLQRFNATRAYQQAYKCSYETARVEGSRTLANPNIKNQLAELKKQQRADLYVTADDIAKEYAKQAFASLGDVLDYKVHEETVQDIDGNVFLDVDDNPVKKHVADIYLKPSDQIDWTLVQDIHRGKDGLVVKLYDKQKALDSLAKLFCNDGDVAKQKLRKLKSEADIVEAKAQIFNDKGDDTETKVAKLLDKIDDAIEGNDDHDN